MLGGSGARKGDEILAPPFSISPVAHFWAGTGLCGLQSRNKVVSYNFSFAAWHVFCFWGLVVCQQKHMLSLAQKASLYRPAVLIKWRRCTECILWEFLPADHLQCFKALPKTLTLGVRVDVLTGHLVVVNYKSSSADLTSETKSTPLRWSSCFHSSLPSLWMFRRQFIWEAFSKLTESCCIHYSKPTFALQVFHSQPQKNPVPGVWITENKVGGYPKII